MDDLKSNLPDDALHFVDFPEVIFFDEFYDHVEILDGAVIEEFEVDGTIEMWLEFTFRGHRFFVNNRFGDYWFYAKDPKCPEDILLEIAGHFRKILEKDQLAAEGTKNVGEWEHPN